MKNKTNSIYPYNSLPARWEHPEREGIPTDRLGHGDIASWAAGTSKPVGIGKKSIGPDGRKDLRPEVGQVQRVSQPIRILANLVPMTAEPTGDKPQPIVVAVSNGFSDEEHRTSVAVKSLANALTAGEHFKKCRTKVEKPEPLPVPVSPFEEIPAKEKEIWLKAKKALAQEFPRGEVERAQFILPERCESKVTWRRTWANE